MAKFKSLTEPNEDDDDNVDDDWYWWHWYWSYWAMDQGQLIEENGKKIMPPLIVNEMNEIQIGNASNEVERLNNLINVKTQMFRCIENELIISK